MKSFRAMGSSLRDWGRAGRLGDKAYVLVHVDRLIGLVLVGDLLVPYELDQVMRGWVNGVRLGVFEDLSRREDSLRRLLGLIVEREVDDVHGVAMKTSVVIRLSFRNGARPRDALLEVFAQTQRFSHIIIIRCDGACRQG